MGGYSSILGVRDDDLRNCFYDIYALCPEAISMSAKCCSYGDIKPLLTGFARVIGYKEQDGIK